MDTHPRPSKSSGKGNYGITIAILDTSTEFTVKCVLVPSTRGITAIVNLGHDCCFGRDKRRKQ